MGKESAKDRKNANATRNEIQKFKSREAARCRRKNESDKITELTRLVPCIPENPPDKSTIIRLATSYIAFKDALNRSTNNQAIGNGCAQNKGVENYSLEVLDGFIIILSKEGTILFVNEKVVHYLGYLPHELMGKKIYNYVLKKDWEMLSKKLRGPLPSPDNPNVKAPEDDPDDFICEPSGTDLFVPLLKYLKGCEKFQFSLRMLCNMMKKNTSKSTCFQLLRFTGSIGADERFRGVVEQEWSPEVGDLPVCEPVFMSRLTPDLKLLYCEGRIHRYMDSKASDIVGRVVYPFYHPNDVFHIRQTHSHLLAHGQVSTVPYRWINKDGGWVWLKSTTTRVKDKKTGRCYMLCVNYVLSAVENKGVVLGISPEAKDLVYESNDEKENENDSSDAYIVDSLTEDIVTKCCITSSTPGDDDDYSSEPLQMPTTSFPQQTPPHFGSYQSEEREAKLSGSAYKQPTENIHNHTFTPEEIHCKNNSWPQHLPDEPFPYCAEDSIHAHSGARDIDARPYFQAHDQNPTAFPFFPSPQNQACYPQLGTVMSDEITSPLSFLDIPMLENNEFGEAYKASIYLFTHDIYGQENGTQEINDSSPTHITYSNWETMSSPSTETPQEALQNNQAINGYNYTHVNNTSGFDVSARIPAQVNSGANGLNETSYILDFEMSFLK